MAGQNHISEGLFFRCVFLFMWITTFIDSELGVFHGVCFSCLFLGEARTRRASKPGRVRLSSNRDGIGLADSRAQKGYLGSTESHPTILGYFHAP